MKINPQSQNLLQPLSLMRSRRRSIVVDLCW
jgi:hypothetical protein